MQTNRPQVYLVGRVPLQTRLVKLHPSSVALISASQPSSYSHLQAQARPDILKPPSSQVSTSQPGAAKSYTLSFPCQEGSADFKFCLVGRFNGKQPSVE